MADFKTPQTQTLISRKIRVTEKFLKFPHCVVGKPNWYTTSKPGMKSIVGILLYWYWYVVRGKE